MKETKRRDTEAGRAGIPDWEARIDDWLRRKSEEMRPRAAAMRRTVQPLRRPLAVAFNILYIVSALATALTAGTLMLLYGLGKVAQDTSTLYYANSVIEHSIPGEYWAVVYASLGLTTVFLAVTAVRVLFWVTNFILSRVSSLPKRALDALYIAGAVMAGSMVTCRVLMASSVGASESGTLADFAMESGVSPWFFVMLPGDGAVVTLLPGEGACITSSTARTAGFAVRSGGGAQRGPKAMPESRRARPEATANHRRVQPLIDRALEWQRQLKNAYGNPFPTLPDTLPERPRRDYWLQTYGLVMGPNGSECLAFDGVEDGGDFRFDSFSSIDEEWASIGTNSFATEYAVDIGYEAAWEKGIEVVLAVSLGRREHRRTLCLVPGPARSFLRKTTGTTFNSGPSMRRRLTAPSWNCGCRPARTSAATSVSRSAKPWTRSTRRSGSGSTTPDDLHYLVIERYDRYALTA